MRPILFTSRRPLERAENIKAVWDAYDGEKEFARLDPWRRSPDIESGFFRLMVTDEIPAESPGKVIMIGHGIAGGKTYGLKQPHPYVTQKDCDLITYVVTTSEEMVPLSAKQHGVPEARVLPLGMPRTDAYFGKRKGDGGSPLAKYRKAYLFAPTFRNLEEAPLPKVDWEALDEMLEDGEILAVKPHMITTNYFPREIRFKHIMYVSPDVISTPYLIDCDVLITDYSSIMLDAHVAGIPVVLFEKNRAYHNTRGMSLKYPSEYAARYAKDEKSMYRLAKSAKEQLATDIECRIRTAGACDGHSTERVVDLIRKVSVE